jgi:hypothetical protein
MAGFVGHDAQLCVGAGRESLRRARRRRAERFYACGALQGPRAARSTRTLGVMRYDSASTKSESEAAILALGGRINASLPHIDLTEMHPRDSHEVASRALVLSVLVHMSFGAPLKLVRPRLEAHGLTSILTSEEREIVMAKSDPSENLRNRLRWNIEALWAAVWAGGLVDDLGPTTPLGDQLAGLLPDLRTQESPRRFLDAFQIRSPETLLGKLDLLYRAHWAARDSRISGSDCPFNEGIVHERRKLLEWALNATVDWDDVEMST